MKSELDKDWLIAEKPISYRPSEDRYCGTCYFRITVLSHFGYVGIEGTYCGHYKDTIAVPDNCSEEWETWAKGRYVFLDGVCDEHVYRNKKKRIKNNDY